MKLIIRKKTLLKLLLRQNQQVDAVAAVRAIDFLKFWFPLLGYSAIIFFLSSLPAKEITFTYSVSDKLLHVLEYSGLGFLCVRALMSRFSWPLMTLWKIAVLGCFIYGISDEIHQRFTPGRDASLLDLTADLAGSMIGAGIYLIIRKRVKVNGSH